MQKLNSYGGVRSIKADSTMKFSDVKNKRRKALPENNDYRLNECKSYAIVFSAEVGHNTQASSSMTSDWHEYMLYS